MIDTYLRAITFGICIACFVGIGCMWHDQRINGMRAVIFWVGVAAVGCLAIAIWRT